MYLDWKEFCERVSSTMLLLVGIIVGLCFAHTNNLHIKGEMIECVVWTVLWVGWDFLRSMSKE